MQSMNIFLQNAYGTSSSAYSSPLFRLFQGVTQGNGAEPVLWMIMSIVFIRCLYLKGLASPHYSLIYQIMFTLIALMHVGYADLNVLNLERKSKIEVIQLGQRIVDDWQFDLSVSGGYLKLEK